MENTEIGVTDGKVLVGPGLAIEHQAMTRAVHGLDTELLFLDVDEEHVFFVFERVAGDVPEIHVVDIWRNHLRVSTANILLPDKSDQLVVYLSAMREEEA